MAWTKQDLEWKVLPVGKINGSAKSPLGEAIKALALFESKWNEAKKHLPDVFDGKQFPALPSGRVPRFSLKMGQDGEAILKVAAAEPSKGSAKAEGDKFSW